MLDICSEDPLNVAVAWTGIVYTLGQLTNQDFLILSSSKHVQFSKRFRHHGGAKRSDYQFRGT